MKRSVTNNRKLGGGELTSSSTRKSSSKNLVLVTFAMAVDIMYTLVSRVHIALKPIIKK